MKEKSCDTVSFSASDYEQDGAGCIHAKLLDEDTIQLDEYEPEFGRNLKGLAKNEYEFQLSKKRLAEAKYLKKTAI